MKRICLLFCVVFLAFLFFNFTNQEPLKSVIGKEISIFKLKNINGKYVSLTDYKNAKGFIIMFTCNHCPFAKLYSDRMNKLNKKYEVFGVPLIALNSMDTLLYEEESFELMQAKAKKDKFNFPYLSDDSQAIGKQFNASHTPEIFVIWKENEKWIIRYAGAFDDNGKHPEKATPFVANAIEELLHNKPVSKPETQSFGCKIFYRK